MEKPKTTKIKVRLSKPLLEHVNATRKQGQSRSERVVELLEKGLKEGDTRCPK
jgi:metal-responsive CopG/Arc/MetJ family transcriptional regulator